MMTLVNEAYFFSLYNNTQMAAPPQPMTQILIFQNSVFMSMNGQNTAECVWFCECVLVLWLHLYSIMTTP